MTTEDIEKILEDRYIGLQKAWHATEDGKERMQYRVRMNEISMLQHLITQKKCEEPLPFEKP